MVFPLRNDLDVPDDLVYTLDLLIDFLCFLLDNLVSLHLTLVKLNEV